MYTWNGMKKITYKEAIERFNDDKEVYLLYSDNTEGVTEGIESIHEHNEKGGEFGYEL